MKSSFIVEMHNRVNKRVERDRGYLEALQKSSLELRKPHDFLKALASCPSIIAEIKFASPSKGKICELSDPVAVAKDYLDAGASALSILTEPDYFKGNIHCLEAVKEAFPEARLLRKDFILDEIQLFESLYYGADAILLIVAFLEPEKLKALYDYAETLGLTALVEVHSKEELMFALALGCKLIGVNNRDLNSLEIDISTSAKLAQFIPSNITSISESGINSVEDVKFLSKYSYNAFLIGSHFMESGQPGKSLKNIINEYES